LGYAQQRNKLNLSPCETKLISMLQVSTYQSQFL